MRQVLRYVPPEEAEAERRINRRHDLTGVDTRLIAEGLPYVLRLKDLSCTGVCGLTDAPLVVGQAISLRFDNAEFVPGRIRWIRRSMFGAAFEEPIDLKRVEKLRRARGGRSAG